MALAYLNGDDFLQKTRAEPCETRSKTSEGKRSTKKKTSAFSCQQTRDAVCLTKPPVRHSAVHHLISKSWQFFNFKHQNKKKFSKFSIIVKNDEAYRMKLHVQMIVPLQTKVVNDSSSVKPATPESEWGRANYVMVSKPQWKPFWLATQLYLQNDWAGWHFHVYYDVCAQIPPG